jgi:hypothetical protein
MIPIRASSSADSSFNDAMCFRGTMSTCSGACGLMSLNATSVASWWTIAAGIWPAMILQKRQSFMRAE